MTAAASKVLGLLLVMLVASKSQGRSSSGTGARVSTPPVGTGEHVPIKQTGGHDFAAWLRQRLALTVIDLAALEPPVDPATIDDVARAIVAQWAHETGKGEAEFNFNLGGWTARAGDNFHTANDRLSGSAFRWTAYPDLPTAIEDQVKRLAVGFPSAWALLLAAPRSSAWIAELGRRGYFTANADDYAQAWLALLAEIRRLAK